VDSNDIIVEAGINNASDEIIISCIKSLDRTQLTLLENQVDYYMNLPSGNKLDELMKYGAKRVKEVLWVTRNISMKS